MSADFGVNWLSGNPRNGISPVADPFPVRADGTRFNEPVRDALGAMAQAGRTYNFRDWDTRRARTHRWRASLQKQLGADFAVEIAYSGSYSDRVYVVKNLNALPAQYWADGSVRNNAVATNLNANVTNPFQLQNFAALSQSSPLIYQDMLSLSFYSATAPKNRLLRPFPQMSGLTQSLAPFGEARTHALEIAVQRRFAGGFNFYATYTRLKAREATQYLNEFDPEPTWMESNYGRPHRVTATGIYQLPFGKGHPFATQGIWSKILGGFQVAMTYEFQPGPLIDWGNLFYYGNLADIAKGPQTADQWFNTNGFERTSSKGPAAYDRRLFPLRVPNVRAMFTSWTNANAQREFRITEGLKLAMKVMAPNLVNRTQFGTPNVNPFSTDFGRVTAAAANTGPRNVMVEARLRF